MKTKKYTIILSGLLAFINIICLLILQFRLYHAVGIYGDGSQIYIDIREILIIITSGVFTSSCVVFIISIREYFDERNSALRNLYRLVSYIDEKYQQIHFFASIIPEEIIGSYLTEKYYLNRDVKDWQELLAITGKSIPSQFLENFKKAKMAYRESVWKHEDDTLKKLYDTEEMREKHLDKKCEEIEKEFLANTEELINSLCVIRDFDVYQIQEAFDKLHFFIHKEYKAILNDALINSTVSLIKLMKYYLNLVSTSEGILINSLAAVRVINTISLIYDETRNHAYLRPSYQIELGKRYINSMRNVFRPNIKHIKAPEIINFIVYPHYDAKQDFGEDILFDSWGIKR